ncbi:MAG: hypothetical protein PHU25_06190 [Deltaproteobacteria bacterium]|nr:hypothetical protein [Deltaproteobacteria bacterium]
MEEYETLRELRLACGDHVAAEVLLDREWWVVRGTPKGMLWVSRPGRNAIHAIAVTRGERFRLSADGQAPIAAEPLPDVIALGPESEAPAPEGAPSGDDDELAHEPALPEPRRRRAPKAATRVSQLKLFG